MGSLIKLARMEESDDEAMLPWEWAWMIGPYDKKPVDFDTLELERSQI
jgi:hypothetical protein